VTTAVHRPALAPTAAVLRDAVKASGMTRTNLAAALKISAATVSNMINAKAQVRPIMADRLGKLLKVDPAKLVSPEARRGKAPVKRLGVAARAVALHEAHVNGVAVLPALPKAVPVLGMEMLTDGTATVTLKVSLPAERGAALFRLLLDFGLTEPLKARET
jgi:transcriptional regulator with XRE-family HTH domain